MNKDKREKRNIASRKDLISFFEKGNLPTDEHFAKLIHSNFNKADDRLDIDEDNGLMIYPANGKLINFFEDGDDEDATYQLSISLQGLLIKQLNEALEQDETKQVIPEFFIEKNTGNIGVGTNIPYQKLDVNGCIASKGRVGTFQEGQINADGQWYNVFKDNLSGVHAFEITAYARGKLKNGKYSLLHAITTSTHGRSKINKTVSHFGPRSNKIDIRWVSKPSRIKAGIAPHTEKPKTLIIRALDWFRTLFEDRSLYYNLQIRTKSHYGGNDNGDTPQDNDIKIFYKIAQLWSPQTISRPGEILNNKEVTPSVTHTSKEQQEEEIEKEQIDKFQKEIETLKSSQNPHDLQKLDAKKETFNMFLKLTEELKGFKEDDVKLKLLKKTVSHNEAKVIDSMRNNIQKEITNRKNDIQKITQQNT